VKTPQEFEDSLLAGIRALGVEPVERRGQISMVATCEANKADPEKYKALTDVIFRHLGSRDLEQCYGVSFYKTEMWMEVRYEALVKYGNKCQCCGATPQAGAVLHVDHIKPRSKYPELCLSIDNLQILCAECNIGKSNKDETDWRK
jgi:hypothetical protein